MQKISQWSEKDKKHAMAYSMMLVSIIVAFMLPADQGYYGVWSMMPPVIMFIFIMLTNKFIESFVWGGFVAIIIKYKWAFISVYIDKLLTQAGDGDNLWLLVLITLIGALIAVMGKSGASRALGNWLISKAKSPRSVLVIAWMLSLLLSFDDYFAAAAANTSMKEVFKKYKIPKELSTTVLRTAIVPGANIWPIGWPVFITGLFVSSEFATKANALVSYYKILPFVIYPLVMIIVSLLIALQVVPKTKVIQKAIAEFDPSSYDTDDEQEEKQEEVKKYPFGIFNFIIPFTMYAGLTLYLGDGLYALIVTLIVTGIMYRIQGILSTDDYIKSVMDGFRDMLELGTLMALSFVLADAVMEIGFTDFVVGAVKSSNISVSFLPLIIFCLFAVTEFLVTLNWTLWMIAMPVIVTLCTATGANPYITIGALLSAGIWGSNSCVISDAGMLTASTARMDKVQHWRSVFPYTVIGLVVSIVFYLVIGLLGL
ncbi:MAG: Na+/H+ antiporter NhaC family protein [Herbinix sp.]|nr:Na+/H+ antiporter NhaC family protein [Herbinix sp.]